MSFQTENKNAFRKIVDLKTMITTSEDGCRTAVHAHLGIFRDEIDFEDALIEIGIKTAFVAIETEGLEIDPTSKFGEVIVPARSSVEHTVTETLTKGVEGSAAAEVTIQGSLSPLKTGAEVGVKRQVAGKETASYALSDTRVETRSFHTVEAIGDDRWKIAAEKGALHGKVLHGHILCEATVARGRPNRRGVSVSVDVRKRDLEVKLTTDKRRFVKFPVTNRERMIALLVARSLAKSSATSASESLLLSVSESFNEE